MGRARLVFLLVVAMLLIVPVVAADEDACGVVVMDALAAIDQLCTGIGRNELCYGHRLIETEFREEAERVAFELPGDIVGVAAVRGFALSALDTVGAVWGVALMRIQANLPDTLPGQNVTMLLMGDVSIEDADEAAPQTAFEATSTGNINVRGGPGTNNPVMATLSTGQVVTANGRSAAGDWLRIDLDNEGAAGWVSASLLALDGDLSALPEVSPGEDAGGLRHGPMTVFYFRSGVAQIGCAEMPPDGILIQTPAGAERVMLSANGVNIEIGSTLFLTAQPGATMRVAVVEGSARVTTEGIGVNVPAGVQAVIPLGADGVADGSPMLEPYDRDELAALAGLIDVMPEQVAIAAPLTDEEITLLARGSLVSILHRDNICAQESVTLVDDFDVGEGITIIAKGIGGIFTVSGGTTVTFTAGGAARLSVGQDHYLTVFRPGTDRFRDFLARSTTPMLTHTFAEDTDFQVLVAGVENTIVELTLRCEG